MQSLVPPWATRLRRWREAVGLSRAELGHRAAVSVETVKAYEVGRRHPSREILASLLDALQLPAVERNTVLSGAGFAPDNKLAGSDLHDPEFTYAEAVADILDAPWPAFISDESMTVVAANGLIQALWKVDLTRERLTPVERHLLCVMTETHFADRIANWDEVAARLSSLVKGSFGEDGLQPGGQAAYLSAVMQHLSQGDTRYLQRFLRHWAAAEPRIEKWRFVYYMTVDHSEAGRMRFRCLVNPVHRAERRAINDWIPMDAESWRGVETLRQLRDARPLEAG